MIFGFQSTTLKEELQLSLVKLSFGKLEKNSIQLLFPLALYLCGKVYIVWYDFGMQDYYSLILNSPI